MTTKPQAKAPDPIPTATKDEVRNFGIEVRLARIRAGTFQRAIAQHMGWHPTAVSQLERGDRASMPDLETVSKLDDFLDAGGHLIAAAGYRVSKDRRRKVEVKHTIELPTALSKRDKDKVMAYIDLLLHDSRRA